MRITGKNLSGRSLKFYLYSVDKEAVVLEELLPKEKFDESYYILSVDLAPGQEGAGGYTLNVETRSFGKIRSENVISGIEFYPVEFSRSIPQEIQNNLQVKNVQKCSTWAYKVDVEGSGLLQLGQGYEEGWITFPRLEHIEVNGWANGWIVPQDTENVYIFFWPQALEWGGMALGGLTLAWVLTKANI